jgi:myogenesis-regulating glycosidase
MAGYPLVLPDMIGGNGYGDGLPPPGVQGGIEGAPNEEIFLRWLAANTFMPSLQFSYVPWDYSQEVQNEALFNAQFLWPLTISEIN